MVINSASYTAGYGKRNNNSNFKKPDIRETWFEGREEKLKSYVMRLKLENRIDGIAKREVILESSLKALYSLIWGQCSDATRTRVESSTGFKKIAHASNSLKLLGALHQEAFSFQSQKYKNRPSMKQSGSSITYSKTELLLAFLDRFTKTVDVVKNCRGDI